MRLSPKRTDIATARLSAKLLQKEFADMAGVSVTHLQKVELGKREPSARITELARRIRR